MKSVEQRLDAIEETLAKPEMIFLKGFCMVPRAAYKGVLALADMTTGLIFCRSAAAPKGKGKKGKGKKAHKAAKKQAKAAATTSSLLAVK